MASTSTTDYSIFIGNNNSSVSGSNRSSPRPQQSRLGSHNDEPTEEEQQQMYRQLMESRHRSTFITIPDLDVNQIGRASVGSAISTPVAAIINTTDDPNNNNNTNSSSGRIKRSTKTMVQVLVAFLKIGEIDTIKEQYSADVYIQARWREPLLDSKTPVEMDEAALKKLWSPCLYIENAISEQKDSSHQSVSFTENGEAYVIEKRKLRGVFIENLELQHFPFDVQDLSVTVVSELQMADVELVPDEQDHSSVNTGTFADEQEWKLYQHVDVTDTVKVELAYQHSGLRFTCRAARRPGYFYYNVFLVMFFITAMSFGIFSVNAQLPQNRLQLSFTLVLTAIAFKMAIAQSLPKISYLTYMDKYILMSLGFLVIICAWISIAPELCDWTSGSFCANNYETWTMLSFFVLYIVGHLTFCTIVYIRALRKQLEMEQKDRDFKLMVGAKVIEQVAKLAGVSFN